MALSHSITWDALTSRVSDAAGSMASLAILLALSYILVGGSLFTLSGLEGISHEEITIVAKGVAAVAFVLVMGALLFPIAKLWLIVKSALLSYLSDMREHKGGPSIDSVLKIIMICGVVTPDHLAAMYSANPKSVRRLLKEASELEEPLVRTVGAAVLGPLGQCYVLTEAGKQRAGSSRRMERTRRAMRQSRLANPAYVANRQMYRRPDLLLYRGAGSQERFDVITDDTWARLRRFLEAR
jgi:hypothetical protein